MVTKLTYQEAADYVWKHSKSIRNWYLNDTDDTFDLDNYTHSEYRTFGLGAPGDVIAEIVSTGVTDGIITEDDDGEYWISHQSKGEFVSLLLRIYFMKLFYEA